MTKAELIDEVKSSVEKSTGKEVSKALTKEFIDATIGAINDCMVKGDEILLQPIGRFGVKFRNQRQASNMVTGEKLVVPAKYVPVFTPTSGLKESVSKLPVTK